MSWANQYNLDAVVAWLKAHPRDAGEELERSYVLLRVREINSLVAEQERAYRVKRGTDSRGRWQR